MKRILIVEDDSDQRKALELRLKNVGYEVVVSGDAQEGIKRAREIKPDLILMDMLLPGISGLEATQKLKNIPETRDIPVVAMTAIGKMDIEESCFRAGAADFIRKPYETQELLDKVKKHLI